MEISKKNRQQIKLIWLYISPFMFIHGATFTILSLDTHKMYIKVSNSPRLIYRLYIRDKGHHNWNSFHIVVSQFYKQFIRSIYMNNLCLVQLRGLRTSGTAETGRRGFGQTGWFLLPPLLNLLLASELTESLR